MIAWTEFNAFLLDLLVKATVLMGVTFFVFRLLGKNHANWRGLVLNLCVVGLLLLPVASVLMPQWQVSFYPNMKSFANGSEGLIDGDLTQASAQFIRESAEMKRVEEVPSAPPPVENIEDMHIVPATGDLPDVQVVTYDGDNVLTVSFSKIFSAAYGLGVLILFLRLGLCGVRGVLFRRALTPCVDGRLLRRLGALKQRLHIRRHVMLAHSDQVQSPTLFGVLRPVIVLPPRVTMIDDVDSVLAHELIHVRRLDCLFRVLGEMMQAIYWVHPLSWLLKGRLSEVQEHACDDDTVATVGNSHGYASLLLHVASQSPKQTLAVAGVEMARKPQVFTRVERILSLGGRVPQPIGRLALSVMGVLFLCVATVLGSITTSKKMMVIDNVPFVGGTFIVDTMGMIPDWGIPRKMRDGRLWWMGTDGLYLQDGDQWARYTLPNNLTFTNVQAFVNARDGSVWFAGSVGGGDIVAHFDGQTWRTYGRKDFGPFDLGWRMTEDEHGGIWIGLAGGLRIDARGAIDRGAGGKGVLHFDGETWHRYTIADGLLHNRVYDVQADPKGGVWVGTLRGLSHYKDGVWTSHLPDPVPVSAVRNPNPYDGHKVYKMRYDRQGNLWVVHGAHAGRTMGDVRSSVSRFDGERWTFYDGTSGFPLGASRYIDEGNDGALWFGSHRDDHEFAANRGMARFKEGMWLRFTQTHGLEGEFVHSVVQRENGELVLGTERGRSVFAPPLDKLAEISGFVTDERNGKAVAHMGVWAMTAQGDVHAGAMTDENGFYRMQVVPGRYLVQIASRTAVVPEDVVAHAQDKKQANLVMLNRYRIVGNVVDEAGLPVPNAVVVLSGTSARDKRFASQVLVSDANGQFEGWQVKDTYAVFQVAAKGHVQTQWIASSWPEKDVKITLHKGMDFKGRVVDQHGKPYVGARVMIGTPIKNSNDMIHRYFQKNAYANAEGAFELLDVNPHKFVLGIRHPDVGRAHQVVVPKPEGVTVVFDRLALYKVSGVVMGQDEPISGAQVDVYKFNPGGTSANQQARTDRDGYYEIDGLEPGPHRIRVSTDMSVTLDGVIRNVNRGIHNESFQVDDHDVTMNFSPLGTASIAGMAKSKGEPVGGAQVFAFDMPKDPTKRQMVGSSWTDDEGRFVLENLPNRKIRVQFMKMDMVDGVRTQWAKADTVDLTLQNKVAYETEISVVDRTALRTVGEKAPMFEATRLDGSVFRLPDYMGKKAVLIDFWATWCGPCLPEIPHIQRIHEKYGDDLLVVGVSLDRDKKALSDFVEKEGVSYTQIFDLERAKIIAKLYGVTGIPSVFLIDKDGIIRAHQLRGTATEDAVRKLLGEQEG